MAGKPPYPPPGLFPGGYAPTPAGGGDARYYQNGMLPHDAQAPVVGPALDSGQPWPAAFPNKGYPPAWEGPRKPWTSGGYGTPISFLTAAQWLDTHDVTLPANVTARATWQSPTFSLRPEFFSLPNGNGREDSIPINRVNAYGGGATCFVLINGVADLAATVEMTVTSFDLSHPFDPSGITVINEGEDITSDFFATAGAAQLPFSAPAGPPAYWAVRIHFDLTGGAFSAVQNQLTAFAACY